MELNGERLALKKIQSIIEGKIFSTKHSPLFILSLPVYDTSAKWTKLEILKPSQRKNLMTPNSVLRFLVLFIY